MADGRCRADWDHTASLLSMMANANRDPKKRRRPFNPLDFHPYATASCRRAASATETTKDLSILKALFVDPKP